MKFGSFDDICRAVSLPFCPLLGQQKAGGIQPDCYARSIDVGGFLIFQSRTLALTNFSATLIIHVVAMIMTAIMIYNIKSKYTAVGTACLLIIGRKEIVIFFYLYLGLTLLEFLLEGNFIQMSSAAYPVLVMSNCSGSQRFMLGFLLLSSGHFC